jgi:hypothetical protein
MQYKRNWWANSRVLFSPICAAGNWRRRTNEEVKQLYGELDIVTEIKT